MNCSRAVSVTKCLYVRYLIKVERMFVTARVAIKSCALR